MHKFAAAYGWDEKKVLGMPAASFLGYLKALLNEQQAKLDQEMKISAHTGWQIRNLINGMMGGEAVGYLDYLEPMGLLTKQELEFIKVMRTLEKSKAKKEAEVNKTTAQVIAEAGRKRGK